MRIVGIVGGVASGKSQVAELLEGLGAGILDADREGHEVLKQGPVKQALRERWGSEVFDSHGEIDRKKIAQIVFAAPNGRSGELVFLEHLTHPRIRSRLQQRADEFRREGKPAAVLDAPLLLEAGWKGLCDAILYVDAPRQVRWERAAKRGWSEEDFARREASQQQLDQKRAQADRIIDNSQSLTHTRQQVLDFWNQFVKHAA